MIWAFFGVLHSLLRAGMIETGRAFRIDSWQVSFLQGLWGLILLAPFAPLMSWPTDELFYVAAFGVGLIFSIGLLIQLYLVTQKIGRVAAISMPLEAFAAMAIWFSITPALTDDFQGDTLGLVAIVIAFVLSSFALTKIRAQDISMKTLLVMAPVALTYAVAGVVMKVVLSAYPTETINVALSFAAVNYAVAACIMGTAALALRKVDLVMYSRQSLKAGLMVGVFSMTGFVTFAMGVTLAPNPGYVSMLAMLLPVWLLAWHGFLRMQDKASPMAALFIIISMLLMIVASM